MANPSNFQITPCVGNRWINFRLYRPRRNPALGCDRPGRKAKVVALVQGLRIYADNNGKSYSTFRLVFVDGRFKESTLQVMGCEGEWAIVGGTGEFARVTGVISKKLHKQRNDWDIIELAIHASCPLPKGPRSPVTKIGPWGGKGGTDQDITVAPRRLESITVYSIPKKVVNSIAFSYIDYDDEERTADRLGGSGGKRYKIQLASSESVKKVSGTFDKYQGSTVILSLKFVTKVNNTYETYGRFGDISGKGTRFSVPVRDSSVIVGFFGRGREYLNAVGVYVHPF